MKKIYLILIMLIVSSMTLCFFACDSFKGEQTPVTASYAPISINVTEEGFEFSHNTFSYFFYTVDHEDTEETGPDSVVYYSEEPGSHTIKVYAKDISGKAVAHAEYTYRTEQLQLSDLTVSGKTVSWVATAKKTSISEGKGYTAFKGTSFTTEMDSGTFSVKAEGGFDADQKIFYAGRDLIRSAKILSYNLPSLPTPKLRVLILDKDLSAVTKLEDMPAAWERTMKLVVCEKSSKASGYAVSYDGGVFIKAAEITLSETDDKGNTKKKTYAVAEISDVVNNHHTIRLQALGDDVTYGDSEPAVYEYETLRAVVTKAEKIGSDRATILATSDLYLSVDDFDYVSAELNSDLFTATASTDLYFRSWGFDEDAKKNYIVSDPVLLSFVTAASHPYVVEDAESEGITDRWSASQGGAVSYSETVEGNAAFAFTAPADKASYRFSIRSLCVSEGYDSLCFYGAGDGVSDVKVILSDKSGNFFLTRDLGVLPAYLQEYTLRFDNADWKINGSAYSLSDLLALKDSPEIDLPDAVRNAFSLFDVICYADSLSFMLSGEEAVSGTRSLVLSDLRFEYLPEVEDGALQPLFAVGSSYVAYEQVGDLRNELLLLLDEEEGACKIYSTALEENFILSGSYSVDAATATLLFESAIDDKSVTFAFADNGRSFRVVDATVDPKEHFLACGEFRVTVDLSFDYDDGERDAAYLGEDWKSYTYWDDQWKPLESAQILYDEVELVSVLRFETGRNLTNRFVFGGKGNAFGLANLITLSLGNCADEAQSLDLKIVLCDKQGNPYYVMGSEGAFSAFEVTEGLREFTIELPTAIDFDSLVFYVSNQTQSEIATLYLGNWSVAYKADPSVFSGYPEPVIIAGEDGFSFSYDEEVVFQYSFDGKQWTEGASCPIPTEGRSYALQVQAFIGDAPSKTAIYAFEVEEVYLSTISVTIGEEGQTATWKTNGNVSFKADVIDGDDVNYGEYAAATENKYFTDKNALLTVRAQGYFDRDHKKYYVGTQEISQKILVDRILPDDLVLQAGQDGIYWEGVEDANAYEVAINNGDPVIFSDRAIPFATKEGKYNVRVRSILMDETTGSILAYSNYVTYDYSVKNVSLPPLVLADDGVTLSWDAKAYKVYLKVGDNEFVEAKLKDSFVSDMVGAVTVTVKAIKGFDDSQRVYYFAEKELTESKIVTIHAFAAPTIKVQKDEKGKEIGLYWVFLSEDGTAETTIEDMASTFPEVSYEISLDSGNTWTPAISYPFPTEAGEYVLIVRMKGNSSSINDSLPSEPFAFKVEQVYLSEQPEYLQKNLKEEGGSVIRYEYTGLAAYYKIKNQAKTPTTEKTFATASYGTGSTVDSYTVYVEGGWDQDNKIFYAGADRQETWTVIVPVKLDAPSVRFSETQLIWTDVTNATEFNVWIKKDEGEFLPVSATNRILANETDLGTYTVKIVAVNTQYEDGRFLDSDEVVFTYRIVDVYLSDLKVNGAVVTWTYRGKISLKVGKNGVYVPYQSGSYVNESGDNVDIFVKAEKWFDEENVVIYRYTGENHNPIVKEQFIGNTQLTTPDLSFNSNKDGLVWSEVPKVYDGYRYRVFNTDLTKAQIAEYASSDEGWIRCEEKSYFFEKDESFHLILVKAKGNESGTIADSEPAVWRYTSAPIYIKNFKTNKGVATWEKSGFVTLYSTEEGLVSNYEKTSYEPNATLTVQLSCKAGYDTVENIFYYDSGLYVTSLEESIVVPIGVALPIVTLNEKAINVTAAVSLSDDIRKDFAFKVKVNDEAEQVIDAELYQSQIGKTLDYRSDVGLYVVTIKTCNKEHPDQYPDSDPVEIRYEVRNVSLSDLTPTGISEQGGTVNLTVNGFLSVSTDGTNYSDLTTTYVQGKPSAVEYPVTQSKKLYVKAVGGFDKINETIAVIYRGDEIVKSKTVYVPVVPRYLAGLDSFIVSLDSYATGYYLSIDGGSWNLYGKSQDTVSYQTTPGSHAIALKAHYSGEGQVIDSKEIVFEYETRTTTISAITVNGATFTWSAEAYSVKRSVNGGTWTTTNTYSYTATSSSDQETTVKLDVQAYGGMVTSSGSNTYYCGGSDLKKSAQVTIKKLKAPTLSVSGKNITWNAVSGATKYAVKVGSGSFVNQTGTTYALSSQAGYYKITVVAVGNGGTIINSNEVIFEYSTVTVSLSNITVSGSKASWTATAYKTYLKVGSGSYSETTATEYSPEGEGTYEIKVKAEGGWNDSEKKYYYASSAIEKSATVKVLALAAPVLTANSKGITWNPVTNASTYDVKIDSGSYVSQSDKSVAFSTTVGSHTVCVRAKAAQNSGYNDSPVATFTYQTKNTSFAITSSSDTRVTWQYTGLKAQYSTNNGSSYSDTTLTGYTASKNGSVLFRAAGGWDANTRTYYNGNSSAQSKTFTLPGLAIQQNFENGIGNWKKEMYGSNGWETVSSTSVNAVTDAYGAGTAVKLHSYLNGMAYRFSLDYGDLPSSYKSMSFDVCLNEYVSTGTTLRFEDSASHTYVDYKLDSLNLTPGVWYHVIVGFEDSNIVITMGGKEYTAPKAKSLVGEKTFYDKIKMLDKFYITVKGNANNGVDAYTFIDNFQFSTATQSSPSKTRITAYEDHFNKASASNWTRYAYEGNKYVSKGAPEIATASTDKDRVINLYAGGGSYKLTCNVGGVSANHFSVALGGDSGTTVNYSIELSTDKGTIYVAGGADSRVLLPSPSGISSLSALNFNFETCKVNSVTIYVSASGNGHLFVDDLILTKVS